MKRIVGAVILLTALCTAGPLSAAPPHHDIDVAFDADTRHLSVTDRLTPPSGGAVSFRIADWLTVTRATADGKTLEAQRNGQVWRIVLPASGTAPVILQLEGRVPPLPADGGQRIPAGAVSGPEGSFLPGYSGWIADTGDDRITYRLRLTVTGGQTGVTSGRLSDESRDNGTYRATFVASEPTEPPSLFVGPYAVKERRDNGIRIRTYFHPELADAAEHYLDASGRYINDFATRIGPYPFADFHVVSAPLPVGLGFPGLTYIGRMIVPLPFMRGRSLAHEVLHNWWGNGVAIDYGTGNWAEGLTTYMADYGLAEAHGGDAAREMRLGWLRDFAALPAERDRPVVSFTARTHQASQIIGYDKVAFIFHMLRQELGEKDFGAGLRLFWRQQKFKVAGWRDIRDAFEQASGRPLEGFFSQWLNRAGAPRIELAAARAVSTGTIHSIELTLRQNEPVYDFAVPIIIGTDSGTVRERVRLHAREQRFSIALQDRPSSISVDPDFDVFRRLLTGESPPILRDVTLAPTVRIVSLEKDDAYLEAARKLAGRLVEGRVIGQETKSRIPLLVIGRSRQIADYLKNAGMEPILPQVRPGTSAAWVVRGPDSQPVLFVRAADPASLRALMRPLPHYGNRSYVVFAAHRAIAKGIWQASNSQLRMDLPD